ncbi:class I SAM-dependent methyltransferase [Pantanalinema rosaneae CENA516]|uniref:class I SAM-dependent methyltransferase n=1 Tax=Pantanalinema rosaneae TaxID=1620701 RepID=UPI003D6EC53C
MKCLNLGCGRRFHRDWTNVDFSSVDQGVITYDLSTGIPFPDNSFDLVYHSHLLEHLPGAIAPHFIKECYRVLRSPGILRIVVPDLEQIARTYLTALEMASSGQPEWDANYNWILLEMYDQVARNQSGGEMVNYLSRHDLPNQEFILQRWGIEAETMIQLLHQQVNSQPLPRLYARLVTRFRRFYKLLRNSSDRRNLFLKLVLGQEYQALEIGRFRLSGEVHYWMYDRYSLKRLLNQCGFTDITLQTATASLTPDWSKWNLDTEPDGTIYKPDSLFMEGVKL